MKNNQRIKFFFVIFLALAMFSFVLAVENNTYIITRENALSAINDSEIIMNEMQISGFGIIYLNDTIIQAKRVFEQAQYAAILRGEVNASVTEKSKATSALRLVNWKEIDYSDVLTYTEEIKTTKQKAFLLLDKLAIEENKINQSSEVAKVILEQARQAFLDERYNDAEKLLNDFRNQLEKDNVDASILVGFKNGAMNFFQRYWIQIIIFLIIASFIGYYVYKVFEKKILQNKIKKMKIQEHVLNDLMKKAQIERFKENKISGLVYNIRFKKYQEKLQTIKEELPVLEDNLRKLSSNNKEKVVVKKKKSKQTIAPILFGVLSGFLSIHFFFRKEEIDAQKKLSQMVSEKYIELNLNDERAGKVAEILSNKTAKKILNLLADLELSETDIANKLGIALNTVDYNIKKLLEAGLIEKTSSFFWSVKGKKIPTYRIANKKIIISTKNSFKGLLGSAIIGAGILGIARLGFNYYSRNQILLRNDNAVYESAPAFMAKASEGTFNLVTSASIWDNVVVWVLVGLVIGALGFFIFKGVRKVFVKGGKYNKL